MGRAKKVRKFAEVKRVLNPKELKRFVPRGAPSPPLTQPPLSLFLAPDRAHNNNHLLPRRLCWPNDTAAKTVARERRRRARRSDKCEFFSGENERESEEPARLTDFRPLARFSAPDRNKTPSALFFKYNSALGPPYRVIIDTNFINFSIKSKVSLPPV